MLGPCVLDVQGADEVGGRAVVGQDTVQQDLGDAAVNPARSKDGRPQVIVVVVIALIVVEGHREALS